MTITQTIDIPDDRRIILEIPREVPSGRTILTYTPVSSKIEQNRKSISQYLGILSPDTYGDAVAYQRQLRNEWND